jgi:hypothetical protein
MTLYNHHWISTSRRCHIAGTLTCNPLPKNSQILQPICPSTYPDNSHANNGFCHAGARKAGKTNFYLEKVYAPACEEALEDNLPVEGDLPRDLDGAFLRIGPNPYFPPTGDYHLVRDTSLGAWSKGRNQLACTCRQMGAF